MVDTAIRVLWVLVVRPRGSSPLGWDWASYAPSDTKLVEEARTLQRHGMHVARVIRWSVNKGDGDDGDWQAAERCAQWMRAQRY